MGDVKKAESVERVANRFKLTARMADSKSEGDAFDRIDPKKSDVYVVTLSTRRQTGIAAHGRQFCMRAVAFRALTN